MPDMPDHADTFGFAGDSGHVMFRFARDFGHVMITHFDPNGPDHDTVVFDKDTGITSFSDLINNHTQNVDGNVVIICDNGSTVALDMSWLPLNQAGVDGLKPQDFDFV